MANSQLVKHIRVEGGNIYNRHIRTENIFEHLGMDPACFSDFVTADALQVKTLHGVLDKVPVNKVKIDGLSIKVFLFPKRHDNKAGLSS